MAEMLQEMAKAGLKIDGYKRGAFDLATATTKK